jgi:protein SCO1/2
MAQASEAPIPKASQFTLNFIKRAKILKSNAVAKEINASQVKGAKTLPGLNFAAQLRNMSKKGLFYIGFFVVLITVFYLVVSRWIIRNDTISVVQPFSFTNQDGQPVTERDVAGKVYVAEYFFTHCDGICPVMNNNMRRVYEQFKNDTNFLILSHTCDPERDSVMQMKYYADSMGVDTKRWVFLTGRKDSLYRTARVSYTIDDPANSLKSIEDQFIHSQFWALVDKKGGVKKIYDGLKESEVEQIIQKIKKLLKQKN